MRWLLALLLILLLSPALAHGCFFRGPNGGVPPGLWEPSDPEPPPPPPSDPGEPAEAGGRFRGPSSSGVPDAQRDPEPPPPPPPCDCALIECGGCSDKALRAGDDVRVSEQVAESKRWGDVVLCRVEISMETSREQGAVEAYVRLEPGPLFAAIAGSVSASDGMTLYAELNVGEEARRKYLHARRTYPFDPMLALRRGPGRIDVRVFPVRKDQKAVVVIEGYLLADTAAPQRARLYRTGERYLAVVALDKDARRDAAALRDERGGRSLHFLNAADCQERFGTDTAEEVPFVAALEAAATGCGDAAASDSTALIAIPAYAPARVGLEPSDPEPQPQELPGHNAAGGAVR